MGEVMLLGLGAFAFYLATRTPTSGTPKQYVPTQTQAPTPSVPAPTGNADAQMAKDIIGGIATIGQTAYGFASLFTSSGQKSYSGGDARYSTADSGYYVEVPEAGGGPETSDYGGSLMEADFVSEDIGPTDESGEYWV
jgi:hypothetical protein